MSFPQEKNVFTSSQSPQESHPTKLSVQNAGAHHLNQTQVRARLLGEALLSLSIYKMKETVVFSTHIHTGHGTVRMKRVDICLQKG